MVFYLIKDISGLFKASVSEIIPGCIKISELPVIRIVLFVCCFFPQPRKPKWTKSPRTYPRNRISRIPGSPVRTTHSRNCVHNRSCHYRNPCNWNRHSLRNCKAAVACTTCISTHYSLISLLDLLLEFLLSLILVGIVYICIGMVYPC